jgi:hypothetical protein
MSYAISAGEKGDMLEVKRNFTLSEINFGVDSYDALRSFFGNVKSNDAVQLVLENAGVAKGN